MERLVLSGKEKSQKKGISSADRKASGITDVTAVSGKDFIIPVQRKQRALSWIFMEDRITVMDMIFPMIYSFSQRKVMEWFYVILQAVREAVRSWQGKAIMTGEERIIRSCLPA